MRAIILAAGRGSRMNYETKDIPKCMIKLWGKTLIEWQVNVLKAAGINQIAIVTGYKGNKIDIDLASYFVNEDWENTNMFFSLMKAQSWLKNYECIVCYSDIIYTSETIRKLIISNQEISIAYYTKFVKLWKQRFENPLSDLETFSIDNDGNILEIGRKPKDIKQIQGQYMGLIKFTPKGWGRLEESLKMLDSKVINKIDMTSLLNHLIKQKIQIHGVKCQDFWLEVDTDKDLELYNSWNMNECIKPLF